jgi:uncharacterized membrane protein
MTATTTMNVGSARNSGSRHLIIVIAMFEILLICCSVGTGLVAGLFYIFSICIMKALNEQTPKQAILAMQSINKIILTPNFFLVFIGITILCAVVLILGLTSNKVSNYTLAFVAAVIYILGSLGVTIIKNVPMNNILRDLNLKREENIDYWRTYFNKWTFWNHIRFSASLISCVLFTLSITYL